MYTYAGALPQHSVLSLVTILPHFRTVSKGQRRGLVVATDGRSQSGRCSHRTDNRFIDIPVRGCTILVWSGAGPFSNTHKHDDTGTHQDFSYAVLVQTLRGSLQNPEECRMLTEKINSEVLFKTLQNAECCSWNTCVYICIYIYGIAG